MPSFQAAFANDCAFLVSWGPHSFTLVHAIVEGEKKEIMLMGVTVTITVCDNEVDLYTSMSELTWANMLQRPKDNGSVF